MQASEIRELNDAEIRDRIAELQEERFRLRLRAATQPLEQPMRLRDVRRDIARLMTVLTERQTGINGAKGSTDAKAPKAARATKTTKAKRATARRGR
ncbi:MAG: 50S ribosomal protein L29 [Gemmatimonadaceae bacterium]